MPIPLYHCWVGISLGCLFYYFIARGFHWDAYSIISLLGGYFIGMSILLFHCWVGISLGYLSFYIIAAWVFHWGAYLLFHCWGISLGCLFYYIIAGWVFHWSTYHSIISLLWDFIGLPILYHFWGISHLDIYIMYHCYNLII